MTNHEYQEAVEWLFVQAPNYQIDGKKAYKPDFAIFSEIHKKKSK